LEARTARQIREVGGKVPPTQKLVTASTPYKVRAHLSVSGSKNCAEVLKKRHNPLFL